MCSIRLPIRARLLLLAILMGMFFAAPGPSGAAEAPAGLLPVRDPTGNYAVLDVPNNRAWFWDLSRFANQNYSQQLASIQQLNGGWYFGLNDWHLATAADMGTIWALDSQAIRTAFHPSHERYEGGYQWHYWAGRYDSFVPPDLHNCAQTAWGNFASGPFDYPWPQSYVAPDGNAYMETGAWVVATIPEPSVFALVVCGAGVVLVCRRKDQ